MAVITISRQIGSLGDSVAQILEKEDRLPRVDQRALEALIRESGIPEETIQALDEKKPSFWMSLGIDRSRYLHYLRSAVISVISDGNAVLVGRGASVLLEEVPGVLRLRLVAPEDVRIRRIMGELGCDRPHAERIMRHSDQDRSGFHRYFFERDWDAPDLYDLTVNTADLTPEEAAEIVREMLQSPFVRCDAQAWDQKMRDMELEQRVISTILYEEQVPVRFFTARAVEGAVTIRGIVSAPGEDSRCSEIIQSIDGVVSVHAEMSFIPDYVGPTW